MKTLLFLLLLGHTAMAQTDSSRNRYFKEIGLSIRIPSGFQELTAAENEELSKKGEETLEKANGIEVDASSTRDLLSIRQGELNYMNITITPYGSGSQKQWQIDNQEVKNAIYRSFVDKVAPGAIDTSSQRVVIGGFPMDRFRMKLKLANGWIMQLYLCSRLYRGYDLGLTYVYVDEVAGEAFQRMLAEARFRRN
jgi:hypothetical protein